MANPVSNSSVGQVGRSAKIVPLPARAPERLVAVGFRCWLAGLSTGDIKCWEDAWNTFSGMLGPENAKTLLLDLSKFVRAVKANAQRDIEISPAGCRSFCRDECLAISIIAACQHDERQALTASAAALIGSADIGDTLERRTGACGSASQDKSDAVPRVRLSGDVRSSRPASAADVSGSRFTIYRDRLECDRQRVADRRARDAGLSSFAAREHRLRFVPTLPISDTRLRAR